MRVMPKLLTLALVVAILIGLVGVPVGVGASDPDPVADPDLIIAPGSYDTLTKYVMLPTSGAQPFETVEAVLHNDTDLVVDFYPPSYLDQYGDTEVSFIEEVSVPLGMSAGLYTFNVDFVAYQNSTSQLIETQTVNVQVVNVAPEVCPVTATINPHDMGSPIIKWDFQDGNGDSQTKFEVEVWTGWDQSGTCLWDPQTFAGPADQVPYAGSELDTSQTYIASVRAFDGAAWGEWCQGEIVWPGWGVWPDAASPEILAGLNKDGVLGVEVWNWQWDALEFNAVSSADWMTIGTYTNSTTSCSIVPVNIDTDGLAVGDYYGEIVVTTFSPIQEVSVVEIYLTVRSWVNPDLVELLLYPGQLDDIQKHLLYPGDPAKIDLFFLIDDTDSFAPYLDFVKSQIPGIFDSISQAFPESRVGLGAFRDFPVSPYGAAGDFPFEVLCNLTTTPGPDVLDMLTGEGAGDELESQYEALLQSATTLDWDSDAYKVIVLATNSGFHDEEDGYTGATSAAAIAALQAAGITVVGWGSNNILQLQDVAAATGGSVLPLNGAGLVINDDINVESPHPYYDYTDDIWWIDRPGATEMRVHLSTIDTESCCDGVYIVDETGNAVEYFYGFHTDIWSQWVAGDRIGIRLTTDGSVTYWGFQADMVEYNVPMSPLASVIIDDLGILSFEVDAPEFSDWVDLGPGNFFFDQSWGYYAVEFTEFVKVPIGTAAGTYTFVVSYLVAGVPAAEQTVIVEVPSSLEPAVIETELFTGECIDLEKWLRMPSLPAVGGTGAVDVLLLQDETGSYGSYIYTLQTLAPQVFDAVRALIPDSRFAVAGFQDFPYEPWGDYTDVPFRLVQDFSEDRSTFVSAVNQLVANGGNDGPESQYQALLDSVSAASWRADAARVILLATDIDFHVPTDYSYSEYMYYPGPSRDTVVQALNDAGITVIGIEPHTIPQLHDVAQATDGTVVSVNMSGEGVAEAIVAGLEQVVGGWTMVEAVVQNTTPLQVSVSPDALYGVSGDSWVSFIESICVPEDTTPGTYEFTIEFWGFYGDGSSVMIAEQSAAITVFDRFDWINIVYMCADNNLGDEYYSWADEALGAMQSADYYGPVRTVVLNDGADWYGGDSEILQTSFTGLENVDDEGAVIPANGEANMGDPATMAAFINWVKANYPADNYNLVIWDHGAGWRSNGLCVDQTNSDTLGLGELSAALNSATSAGADKLAVIAFDACLMQMLEVDYQIMGYAQFAVGSEEVIPAPGLPYDTILSAMASDPTIAPAGLAALIVDLYAERYTPCEEFYYHGFPCGTLSAKDLSQISTLKDAVDALAVALMGGIGTYDQEIADARNAVETFGDCDYWYDEPYYRAMYVPVGSIDLYDYARILAETLPGTDIATAAAAVMTLVDNAVVANWAGELQPNANGIAIYYPDFEGYDPQGLIFEPAYLGDTDFGATSPWTPFIMTAPRQVCEGLFAAYMPHALVLAHATADSLVRFAWPDAGTLDGFVVTNPISIVVTPEGSIDFGAVALLYTQDQLDAAGILKTQIVGVAQQNADQWELLKLTMDTPTWIMDLLDIVSNFGFSLDMDSMNSFLALTDGPIGGSDGYVGAVISIPWLDLGALVNDPGITEGFNLPEWRSSEVNTLGIVATTSAASLTPIQYPQNLYQGWNLISIPVIPVNGNVADVVSGYGGLVEGITDDLDVIWEYDAAAGVWRAYSPAHPEASDLTQLRDGVGYWVKMAGDATLTVIGSNMMAGPYAPPEYDVVEGWNLIGYKGILPMPVQGGEYYDYYDYYCSGGYLDSVDFSRLQGWNRVWDSQVTPDFLQPNEGYWIYVDEAGSIPGLNDELWIQALQNEAMAEEWLLQTIEWVAFWAAHDAELGLRLAWNVLWYAGWVVAPDMLYDYTDLLYYFI